MSVDPSNNINLELLTECISGTYNINDDGSIDVGGDVIIRNTNLTKIPFKFRNVRGDFYCYKNQLTSLEGAPNSVGGSFLCSNNQLISLDGAPKMIGYNFYCRDNPNLPYSELFKMVDRVKGGIYSSSRYTSENKDKIRSDRDIKELLKDDELGSLDV